MRFLSPQGAINLAFSQPQSSRDGCVSGRLCGGPVRALSIPITGLGVARSIDSALNIPQGAMNGQLGF